jgi:hypothetical protein
MGRRIGSGLIAIGVGLALASPAQAQDPLQSPTPAPPVSVPPGCAVTEAGLVCPQLPPGCVVTSAGLLCPGGVAGETAVTPDEAPKKKRRRPRGGVAPTAEEHVAGPAPAPAPPPPPLRRLAFTGWDGAPVALAGAALLLAGLGLRRTVRA